MDFNILVVLTKQVANRIEPIYKFFKKQNFKHLQFIPMLKPLRVDESGKPISKTTYNECFPSEQENYSMSAEDYSEFCKVLCDVSQRLYGRQIHLNPPI